MNWRDRSDLVSNVLGGIVHAGAPIRERAWPLVYDRGELVAGWEPVVRVSGGVYEDIRLAVLSAVRSRGPIRTGSNQ